jgi:hypothetical protein
MGKEALAATARRSWHFHRGRSRFTLSAPRGRPRPLGGAAYGTKLYPQGRG